MFRKKKCEWGGRSIERVHQKKGGAGEVKGKECVDQGMRHGVREGSVCIASRKRMREEEE